MIAKSQRQALAALASMALASSLVLGACGQVVRSASAGSLTDSRSAAQTIHDPENPYWIGATGVASITTDAATTTRTLHDPDNANWIGSAVTVPAYADPVRGPR